MKRGPQCDLAYLDETHYLERGAKDKDYWLIFINIDPDLDPLRNDPRFGRLVQTVGIPRV